MLFSPRTFCSLAILQGMDFEEIVEDPSERRCLVCSAPITAMHFGMDTCRACSSFFKRVRLSGKSYNCRKGDGQCAVTSGAKSLCRQCRFEKCLAVGLSYDGPLRINKRPANDSLDPIDPVNIPSSSTESFLDRIGREFNNSIERRRAHERIFLRESDETRRVPHPSEEMYVTSYATTLKSYDYTITETWSFFKAVFPNLQALSLDEQRHLFALYLPKFSVMEAHFRTRKIWGAVGDYLMTSALICADLRNPDTWVGRNDGGENRPTLIQSIEAYTREQCALIVPMMNRTQLTNKEFHASLALLLCDTSDVEDLPDAYSVLLDEIQVEALEELQRYYKHEMGLSDFSTRLGNLMTLNHAVRVSDWLCFDSCFTTSLYYSVLTRTHYTAVSRFY
ncbi:hypothetical protein PRIPAC_76818 [Pristionchus pacificus]|nr:hypothetical protein PRIPAC_76818 [Pristionchus pacificus]